MLITCFSLLLAVLLSQPVDALHIHRYDVEQELHSPRIVDWGVWGDWDMCSHGEFVVGAVLLVTPPIGNADDTALDGVKLYCSRERGSSSSHWSRHAITSKLVNWNGWGQSWGYERICNGYAIGFQLKVYGDGGRHVDDVGAADFRLICDDGDILDSSNGIDWGSWSPQLTCPEGQVLCGIQTQVYGPVTSEDVDETTLSNVDVKCCRLPVTKKPPCEVANDDWVDVLTCNNEHGSSEMECEYQQMIGVSKREEDSKGGSKQDSESSSFGGDVEVSGFGLSATFSASIGKSSTTGFDWRKASESTWNKASMHTVTIKVPPNVITNVQQVTGICGPYLVNAGNFRRHDSAGSVKSSSALGSR